MLGIRVPVEYGGSGLDALASVVVAEALAACTYGGFTVTAEHAKGDVAARGSASDLLLFLWGRVPADSLEVFGDAELLARFRQAIRV